MVRGSSPEAFQIMVNGEFVTIVEARRIIAKLEKKQWAQSLVSNC